IDTDLTGILLNAADKERRFITTLKSEDIRVSEDGVPQQITTFERETDLPLSLAFLVDTSASQEAVLEEEQSAANIFIDSVLRPQKDTAAVVSFTGEPKLEQTLTGDRAQLHAAIGRVKVEFSADSPECNHPDDPFSEQYRLRCSTGIWDSIWATVNELLSKTPERTRRALILLTDGDDTSSKTSKGDAFDFAVRHNAVIYSIGIRDESFKYGGSLKRDDLRKVSERTGGRAFFPKNRAELDAAFAQINQELRTQYLVAYAPTNRKRDGSLRKILIEVVNPALRREKLRLQYRQSYYAKTAARPGG
ncbi:MAG: VWA domain-containing protein, partial [Pyrinomonadaceae bacterium]